MNSQLDIYLNREMATEYYLNKRYCIGKPKEAYRYPRLIITNDNRLGWAVYYEIIVRKVVKSKNKATDEVSKEKPQRVKEGITRISFAKGTDQIVKTNVLQYPWFRRIEIDSYFLYQGDIWHYKVDKVSGKHWIIRQNVITSASIFAQLQITDSYYMPYMSVDKKTRQVINCYWIAEKENRMQDMQAVFRNLDANFNPVRHKLIALAYWDDFIINGEKWHIIEHKGQEAFSLLK